MREKLRAFYQLTKPGIVYGNALHTIAGVFLAYKFGIDVHGAFAVVIGSSLIIASACIINNYIDRDLDRKMTRTKSRPSVTNQISVRAGGIVAAALVLVGFVVLIIFTNWLAVLFGAIAYVFYVVIYAVAKRKTVHGTLVGAIPGALPAAAGYVAISGQFDITTFLLFVLIVAWQMPHFYAISLFRKKDYQAAGLPVLGAVRGTETVRRAIIGWIVVYMLILVIMAFTKTFNIIAAVVLIIAAFWWLESAVRSFSPDTEKRARIVFGRSLVLTLLFFVVSILNSFIH